MEPDRQTALSVSVEALTVNSVWSALDALGEAYWLAFSNSLYAETREDAQRFQERLTDLVYDEGFRGWVARDRSSHAIVGFSLGYTSSAERSWALKAAEVLGRSLAQQWLSDCFECVELAVVPDYRRQGIGTQLHDHLLAGLPHATALLITRENSPALQFYRQQGWQPLGLLTLANPDSPNPQSDQLLGLRLRTWQTF
ncbi:MAG: GNAT family N-acetyltransferase [Kaiparowitsia implicata GSE-PSE-MK54-09C]|jgi:ribosomal protein S18 acetylase RimI-like enzyme|nr:GNAT family N-acetyltransferase [Kaiparowitsia implicata GSE-PSE-MK54-09C]